MRQHFLADTYGNRKKNMDLRLLHKDTAVEHSTNEHEFQPSPSPTASQS